MFRRRLPPAYQNRDPAFDTWVDGGYDDATARRLLSIISKAFRLDESDAFKLRPDDSVWALYRHYYPRRSGWGGWIDAASSQAFYTWLSLTRNTIAPLVEPSHIPPG